MLAGGKKPDDSGVIRGGKAEKGSNSKVAGVIVR